MTFAALLVSLAVTAAPVPDSGPLPLSPRDAARQRTTVVPTRSAAVAPRLHASAGGRHTQVGPADDPVPSPADVAQSRGSGPLSDQERARRDAGVHALVTAEAQATEQPQTAGPALHQALRDFTDLAPLVADDPQAQTARAYAMLATARTALVLGEAQRAADALDEALGVARGSSLPVESFGPSLEALHAQREAVFATRQPGRLQVRCNLPCVVYVDERPFVPLEGPLPPGPHRVWIEAEDPGHAVARHVVDIRAGRTEALDYTLEREPAVTDEIAAAPPAAPKRLLPRWASILGLAVGTGVAVTGGVLVAVDHRCPDLTDPRDNRCIRILNTDAGGWTLVGLGTATAIVGAVILAIDETRARRHQR